MQLTFAYFLTSVMFGGGGVGELVMGCISGAMGCSGGRGGGMWASNPRHMVLVRASPAAPATLSSRQIDRYTRVHQSLCTPALGRVQLQVLFNFHSAPIILQQPVGKG